MTTTTLQWHAAAKEDPPRNGYYLVAHVGDDVLDVAEWDDGRACPWQLPDGTAIYCCDVEFWAAIPSISQVRRKFRDEELRQCQDL